MRNFVIIATVFIILVLGGLSVLWSKKNQPYLIEAGRYPMTVQFISDTPGFANITKQKDSLLLEGASYSIDNSGFINVYGKIKNIAPDSFIFVGNIKMFASKQCCGLINKTGSWTFRRMENRNFFRLKERDELCSCKTCCIYLDIHIKPKI